MTFWTSSESYKDIRKQLRPPLLFLESEIKSRVELLTLDTDAKKWAVIYMIAPEPYSSFFPEFFQYSSRETVLEFRLQVDYQAFKLTSEPGRITLLLNCLLRSIELMEGLGIDGEDRAQLIQVVKIVDDLHGDKSNFSAWSGR